jgi:tetratricopeptide (TPR) repeat protein
MTFLRIKQAEAALADDRLDEALSIVQRADVRAHRRGQELVTKVTDGLLTRARKWVGMERFADAAMDADKAIRLAGALPDAVELKAQAAAAMLDSQQRHRQSANAVARARFHLNQGRIAAAQQFIERGEMSTGGLHAIMDDLSEQAERALACLDRARAAIVHHDYESAVNELLSARKLDSTNADVASLIDQLHNNLVQQASELLNDGRVDKAALLELRLSRLVPHALDVEELRQSLTQLRGAWEAIERGQPRRAEEVLRRLFSTLPEAKWMRDSADRLAEAAAAMEAVRAGPMGLVNAMKPNIAETLPPPAVAGPVPISSLPRVTPPPLPGSPRRTASLAGRLLLQVDGAGSFIVVRDPAVILGPISSSSRVQVGFVCEPNTPSATIERNEDDYFLRGGSGVAVNDAPMVSTPAGQPASKLLGAGDRIALSPRCRMMFAMPVPASTTATLDLTGARHPRSDVRRVILMDRDVVIGPGGASHVRVDSLNEPVMLFQRDGQLFLRGGTAVTMGDQPIDETTPLQANQPVRGAGFGLVITPL